MKPFDLEAAKRGEPIMFRDGTPATFGSVSPDGTYCMVWFRGNQLYTIKTGNSDFCDIVMAPRKVVKWAVLATSAFSLRGSKEDAERELEEKFKYVSGLNIVRLEWEE
jgi:hypothetical protein